MRRQLALVQNRPLRRVLGFFNPMREDLSEEISEFSLQ
jgi:hypothetical protein